MTESGVPILAPRAGTYVEMPPIAELHSHFQCGWQHSVYGNRPISICVIPDGCVDLLWREDRLVVVGPDVSAAHTVLSPQSTIVGVRFHPGAAPAWLGVSLAEIVGAEVPMTKLWGRRADLIGQELAEARNSDDRLRVLQQRLAQLAPSVPPAPRAASALFRLLGSAEIEQRGVASILKRLNMSERTLRRWSNAHFGYGVKMLDRILRFQKFRRLVLGSARQRLADLAIEAGYADQAHLSREVRALTGMTAAQFAKQLLPLQRPSLRAQSETVNSGFHAISHR